MFYEILQLSWWNEIELLYAFFSIYEMEANVYEHCIG